MMLTFSVVPQTLLVKGFQPTVNQTEKPSLPSPTQTIHPLTADSFTPSAVKSRAGGNATEALEALEALKGVLNSSNFEQGVLEKAQQPLSQLEEFINNGKTRKKMFSKAMDDLREIFKDNSSLSEALSTFQKAFRTRVNLTLSDDAQEMIYNIVTQYGRK